MTVGLTCNAVLIEQLTLASNISRRVLATFRVTLASINAKFSLPIWTFH